MYLYYGHTLPYICVTDMFTLPYICVTDMLTLYMLQLTFTQNYIFALL